MKFFTVILFLTFLFRFAYTEEKVYTENIEGFTYAAMECSGSYEGMSSKINLFMNSFFQQGLSPAGPFISLFMNSPEEVKESQLKWDIGFPVSKEVSLTDPLKLKSFKGGKGVKYLHIGSYENMEDSFNKVKNYCKKNGYQMVYPVINRYLNSPQQVAPSELKTLITVLVKEKVEKR